MMRIRDLTVEITETKDTVSSADSGLILHRECPRGAAVGSGATSELTGTCKNSALHYPASRRGLTRSGALQYLA